jgi:hypothetical protein
MAESASDNDLIRPGSVVETSFGVGVIVEVKPSKDGDPRGLIQVKLWRAPGRSIGTAATAYLQPSAVS